MVFGKGTASAVPKAAPESIGFSRCKVLPNPADLFINLEGIAKLCDHSVGLNHG
jgi:hypothetical protein